MGYNLAYHYMNNLEEKNEEIQNRREFFKNAAKKALPLFAVALLGTGILSSCTKDKDSASGSSSGCGHSCSGSCSDDCSGNCIEGCQGDCYSGCYGDCYKYSY